ncbi:Rrf2 family transcriptional regulator [Halobacteriovorax sp. GB3]|uniref:RrF2 family transcriptional regulator n=1 Tax=Halobacteriovorax sp. GB3 TaxID=2719615 RepID=UPI0023616DBE|nr:Rrf2 family transcriptional regulator [Halobacteriovorax sp. GB3]MDD0851636.1 Rrf2 family transcriptional regulator [Halobacteriovorax sp. GB3]
MRLASFTDYSLRVLIYLAIKGQERSTVSEIADKYKISRNHLVKVVHNLSNMGVITSFKGKGGGIVLSKEPVSLKIGKLIKELESDSNLVECFGNSSNCAINPSCKLKAALKVAENKFYEALDGYTLEDILVNKDKLSSSLGIF